MRCFRKGNKFAFQLLKQRGKAKVGFIGLNPAIALNLTETFGAENVRITDLNEDNIDGLVKSPSAALRCNFVVAAHP